MAVSFLYPGFCRLLAVLRRMGRPRSDVAVEMAMLRHEVTVLRPGSHDRRSNLGIGPSSAVFGGRCPSRRRRGISSSQPRCCAGMETCYGDDRRTPSLPADQRREQESASWFAGSLG